MADKANKAVKDNNNNEGPSSPSSVPARTFWQTINPGYVVAGISTLATSWLSIGKNYHKNGNATGRYFEADKAYQRALEKVRAKRAEFRGAKADYEARFDKVVDKIPPDKFTSADSKALRDVHKEVIQEIERDAGIPEGAIRGTLSKWGRLEGYQQAQISLAVITVTSIALGAIYSFTRERRLAEKLHQQIADQQQQQIG